MKIWLSLVSWTYNIFKCLINQFGQRKCISDFFSSSILQHKLFSMKCLAHHFLNKMYGIKCLAHNIQHTTFSTKWAAQNGWNKKIITNSFISVISTKVSAQDVQHKIFGSKLSAQTFEDYIFSKKRSAYNAQPKIFSNTSKAQHILI